MTAFKYTHSNTHNPYIQASVRSKRGNKYHYNGRFYLQAKAEGVINYTDLFYDLSVKLVSWTSNTVDLQLEIKNIEPKDQVIDSSLLDNIISSAKIIENTPIYLRIDNRGQIIKVFNSIELLEKEKIIFKSDESLIEYLDRHPILSAYICGQISSKINLNSKTFTSLIYPEIKAISDINVTTRKLKLADSFETIVSGNKSFLKIRSEEDYTNFAGFSLQAIFKKSEKNMLPYSFQYTIEELYDNNINIFSSIGIEQVVNKKDLSLKDKIICKLQSQLGSFL